MRNFPNSLEKFQNAKKLHRKLKTAERKLGMPENEGN